MNVVDLQPLFKEITCVKTEEDAMLTRVAAKFTNFSMKELISRIENIIDI